MFERLIRERVLVLYGFESFERIIPEIQFSPPPLYYSSGWGRVYGGMYGRT